MEARNKVMPWFLKVIAAYLLACGTGLVVFSCTPICPHADFEGNAVSFFQWWLRGFGPLVFMVGLVFLTLCYGLTFAKKWSRLSFLVALSLGRIKAIVQTEGVTAVSTIGSLAVLGFLAWYFYRRHTVVAYFAKVEQAAKTP